MTPGNEFERTVSRRFFSRQLMSWTRRCVAALFMTIAGQGHAKCVNDDIAVTGAIRDFDRRPISGATVVVSFVEIGEAHSVVTYSGADGKYSIVFPWYPWREPRWFERFRAGDRCDGTLQSITLRVIAAGFEQAEEQAAVLNQRAQKDVRLAPQRDR